MSRNIIRDGQTRQGYIAAVEGLHDELRFEYRPMLPLDVDAIDEAVRTKSASEGHKIMRAAIRDRLIGWSEVDERDQPVKITTDTIRTLPPRLFNRLIDIISGRLASDSDPQATPRDEDESIKAILRAAEEDKTPGQTLLESSEKN